MITLMARLISPSVKYKAGFLASLRENYHDPLPKLMCLIMEQNQLDRPQLVSWLDAHFPEFIALLNSSDLRHRQYPSLVDQYHFWLIDQNDFIGRLILRPRLNTSLRRQGGHLGLWIRPSARCHGYGTRLFRAGLLHAQKKELGKILVTCHDSNVLSQKIILYHHGRLTGQTHWTTPHRLRYWVPTYQT